MASAFKGFSQEGLDFLVNLSIKQDREWFQANKPVFDSELRLPMIAMLTELQARLGAKGMKIGGDPAKAVFRIYRDTRFSKDKKPYKTNIGARLGIGDDRLGVLYFHVDPWESFLAAGFYMPEPPDLRRLRERMVSHSGEALAIAESLTRSGFRLHNDDMLARMPKGFEAVADERLSVLLRRKSYSAWKPVEIDDLLDGERYLQTAESVARATWPLLEFGWKALEAIT